VGVARGFACTTVAIGLSARLSLPALPFPGLTISAGDGVAGAFSFGGVTTGTSSATAFRFRGGRL